MPLYYQDDTITLHHGDSLAVARTLEPGSADCIVTSPPYYGLRDYGNDGQYGLEESPAEYVETMRALFSELRRVLDDDGTLWLNLGDTYRKKQLMGIPWRVAFALQGDGWILRNEIIWNKPNGVPESVGDRLSKKHESIFFFSKSPKYHFDLDAIRVPHSSLQGSSGWAKQMRAGVDFAKVKSDPDGHNTSRKPGAHLMGMNPMGKNPGTVWDINTKPFKEAHFAVMPPEIARRATIAACKPGGTVLDPFSGSGTTGMVARQEGRKYVGIDISASYLNLSLNTRLQGDAA